MSSTARKVNLIANVTVITIAIIAGVIIAKRYLLATPPAASKNFTITEGQELPLLAVDWSKNSQTLVVAFQKNCGPCAVSLPFYKSLADEVMATGLTQLVVVAPHPVSESQEYLAEKGISVNEVRQVRLRSVGVTATPTLILLNSSGVVIAKWVGLLAEEQQREVLSRVGGGKPRPPGDQTGALSGQEASTSAGGSLGIAPPTLNNAIAAKERIVVLDVSERKDFALEHIPNAVNIPLDELGVRALNELSKSDRIIVYSRGSVDAFGMASNQLTNLGFPQPTRLQGGLNGWKQANLPVASEP